MMMRETLKAPLVRDLTNLVTAALGTVSQTPGQSCLGAGFQQAALLPTKAAARCLVQMQDLGTVLWKTAAF